jgi:hypothetical protein
MRRLFVWLLLLAALSPVAAEAAGKCAIYAMKRGDLFAHRYDGNQSGLDAAAAYAGTNGYVQVYPGCDSTLVMPTLGDSTVLITVEAGVWRYRSKTSPWGFELSENKLTNADKPNWVGPSLTMAPNSRIFWREYQTPFVPRAFISKDTNNVVAMGCSGCGPIDYRPNNVYMGRFSSTGLRVGDNVSPSTVLDVNGTATFRSQVVYGTPATLADNTTPSVANGTVFKCTPAGATTITTFTGATAGQIFTIIFTNGNATLSDSGTLKLSSGAALTADDTITLIYDGTNFYEMERSAN